MNIKENYLGLYKLRKDKKYDLWAVFTRIILEDEPISEDDANEEDFIFVWKSSMHFFPAVWELDNDK